MEYIDTGSGVVAGAIIRQNTVSAHAFGSIENTLIIRDGMVVTNVAREDVREVQVKCDWHIPDNMFWGAIAPPVFPTCLGANIEICVAFVLT